MTRLSAWLLSAALVTGAGVGSTAASPAQRPTPEQRISRAMSLREAVALALKNNFMVDLMRERLNEAKGRRREKDSDLLPHLAATASQRRVFWQNLASEGLAEFGVIGPFNSFDARVQMTQRVFDLSAISRVQAADTDVKIASLKEALVRQQVITAAVLAYLDVLRGEARLQSVEEDMRLANRLVSLAQHQREAGIVTDLDVTRARTRLARQKAKKQEILQGLHTAYFHLERVTDLPLDSKIHLKDSLKYFEDTILPGREAILTADKDRIEMAIADAQVRYRRQKLAEARNERLPTIEVSGDYGQSAEEPDKHAHDAAQVAVRFNMPLFEGGRIGGKIQQQQSLHKQERLKQDDMATQVEEDVRLAIQTLATSTDFVRAAKETLDLASREVEQAQRQYAAGVGDNIAVVESQTTLERARESYIQALTQYHTARVNYYSALGKTESFHLNPL